MNPTKGLYVITNMFVAFIGLGIMVGANEGLRVNTFPIFFYGLSVLSLSMTNGLMDISKDVKTVWSFIFIGSVIPVLVISTYIVYTTIFQNLFPLILSGVVLVSFWYRFKHYNIQLNDTF